jgi:tRNA(fMet)-specific endonuclease VapC
MSLYVLDTDALTLVQYKHPVLEPRVMAHPPAELAITVVTVEEQLTGWYTKLRQARTPDQQSRAYQDLADAVSRLSGVNILGFPVAALNRVKSLLAAKLNVGKKDLAIAAIALEHGGILVSRNLRDFQRVPGLMVEDWSV